MKIEKLSENQIRCILTGEDLAKRQLKLSELAYGTDKARRLFQDMMQQASFEYGFEADNIPLVIEAVPLGPDSIALIVTKIENPDELDTRFASFAPSVEKGTMQESQEPSPFEQLLESLRSALPSVLSGESVDSASESRTGNAASSGAAVPDENLNAAQRSMSRLKEYAMTHRLFSFGCMADVTDAAAKLSGAFAGHSALYQDEAEHTYYLFLAADGPEQTQQMQAAYAVLSEYGYPEHFAYAREQSLFEHCRILLKENALEQLSSL